MREKLSAVIIDPDEGHNYDLVKTEGSVFGYAEDGFDLVVLRDGRDILPVLSEKRGFDAVITVGGYENWQYLSFLPFSIRRRWSHVKDFNPKAIANLIVDTFKLNVNRDDGPKSFSIFTCTYNTEKEQLLRLYNSLLSQTYREWDWFILDDSTDDRVEKALQGLKDPRVTVIKNISDHGRIGFNKHVIATSCDGDYLVEVDHDDELTPDCLEYILRAFETFPDTDFIYSNVLELRGDKPIVYGEGWAWGEGYEGTEIVNGNKYFFSMTPEVTPYSIRTIYSQPNHVRCWKREFYNKIGGHDVNLSVLDDMELLIRTFLYGKMTKVEKTLYIQHEKDCERTEGNGTTQSVRFREIQRSNWLLKDRYDKAIHDRIIELGYEDTPWDKEKQSSDLEKPHKPRTVIMCNILKD